MVLLQAAFCTPNGANQQSPHHRPLHAGDRNPVHPLRRRVQDFIDRRFYRKKYNAEQALAQFATVAQDGVDMDKLTVAMLNVVQETVQPEKVSLWLKQPSQGVDVK